MRRRTSTVLVAILMVGLGACSDAGPADSGQGVPFELYTHCGIHELRVDDDYYQRADGPLTDGNGNPPDGWDNPYQSGRLVVSGDTAVFTDAAGHREAFRLRPDATEFLQICD